MRPAPEGSSADPSPAGDALLLFTSGSTGRPKGTRLTHRNLLAGARFVAEAHRLTPEDRSLVILPLSHINGEVIAFLAPLLSGGSIVLPHRFRTGPFWDWLRNFHCTWFSAVPTIFSILIQKNKEAGSPAPGNLKYVRFARSASAALPVAVFHEFEKRFGLPVVETMGITEAAGMILTNPLPPGRRIAGSVGLPWGNEARIEDGNGSPLPPGEEGEVAAKGPNVMPGYFQNPAATREALSGGWLRTGDLGMRDDEGYFYITGRKKDLINRAGEMIAPREIDEVLYKHPDVLDAAALGIPHPLYGEEVKAFVVLRPGADCREEDILAYCRERLAEFKCPKSAAFIPDIPKGPSGKLLRSKLRSRYTRGNLLAFSGGGNGFKRPPAQKDRRGGVRLLRSRGPARTPAPFKRRKGSSRSTPSRAWASPARSGAPWPASASPSAGSSTPTTTSTTRRETHFLRPRHPSWRT